MLYRTASRPLTAHDRAVLRGRIDALRRQELLRKTRTHRVCMECGWYLHRAEFDRAGQVCLRCREVGG